MKKFKSEQSQVLSICKSCTRVAVGRLSAFAAGATSDELASKKAATLQDKLYEAPPDLKVPKGIELVSEMWSLLEQGQYLLCVLRAQ